jgi:chromosome segregation ATPase
MQIDLINKEIKETSEKRKTKKDRAEELEAILNNHQYTQEQIDRYSNPRDVEAIQAELSAISANQKIYDDFNMKVEGLKNQMTMMYNQASNHQNEAERKKAEIVRLQAEVQAHEDKMTEIQQGINELDTKLFTGQNWLNSNHRPVSDEVVSKLNEATTHNLHCANISGLAEKQREMLKFKEEVLQADNAIKKLEDDRSTLISKSQLPIKDLTFTDDEIFLNGIPLEEGQVNTAKLFEVGVDVAIALNPGLKTIFLHDGSLFDKDNLRVIVDKIESRGYQAIIEVVAENDDVEVKFTEEELK